MNDSMTIVDVEKIIKNAGKRQDKNIKRKSGIVDEKGEEVLSDLRMVVDVEYIMRNAGRRLSKIKEYEQDR